MTTNESMFCLETDNLKTYYSVTLETVLSGHEGWVSQIRWTLVDGSLRLLSASMDKTMILWQPPTDSSNNGVWMESARVGEVGGNTLGFLGCAVSVKLDMIVGYSFNGALHCWKCVDNAWKPYVVMSGHFDEVTDIAWEPQGQYLLSCSSDQTTRLHSICSTDGGESWHELARPQIHGYDIKCIAMVGRHSFVSGADEKVLRVFRATKCFANTLIKLSNIDISVEMNSEETAHSASVPTLGLSNCAVYEPQLIDHQFKPETLETLPTEETLLQNTLWPEIHKLYGHVFEIFSVATSNDHQIVASASKASKAEHADIILWDLTEAKQIGKLSSHQLTVTRIRFSSNDRYILSASRDRTWALFERQDLTNNYKRVGFTNKTNGIHSRIIWDIAFTHDFQYFCSVSRDKTAVFWAIDSEQLDITSTLGPVKPCGKPLVLSDSITAVDICKLTFGDNYLIAFGLDNGNICIYFWNKWTLWNHLLDLNERLVLNGVAIY